MVRTGGKIVQSNIGTTEKEPRFVELIARGPAGHGSVPSRGNAVTKLSAAVGKVGGMVAAAAHQRDHRRLFQEAGDHGAAATWRRCIATCSIPIRRSRRPAADWLLDNEPYHWSMLHTSLVPTIVGGGFRYNVIPSEAKATIDVRLHPDEDQSVFLDQVRKVINDPSVEVRWGRERYRPAGGSRIDTEAYRGARGPDEEALRHHRAADDGHRARPTCRTSARRASSATASVRRSTPKIAPKGFGAHSDQERILESELHRFVRFQYDVVVELARAR